MSEEKTPAKQNKPAPAPPPPPPVKAAPPKPELMHESGWSRISRLPPLKRSIVMAEILGPHGGLGERG